MEIKKLCLVILQYKIWKSNNDRSSTLNACDFLGNCTLIFHPIWDLSFFNKEFPETYFNIKRSEFNEKLYYFPV